MTSFATAFPAHPAASLRRGFELTKWYIDVVAPDGRGAIAHWVELTWHGVRGRAGSILTFGPNQPTEEHTALEPGDAPPWHGQTLDWTMPALGTTVLLQRRTAGAAIRLLGELDGSLDWNCVAPHAPACITVNGRSFDGVGYAECLRTSLPPWRLPAHSVRWGRALFRERSVVWLQWLGAEPRDVLLLDGHQVTGAIHADRIDLPHGEHLSLDAPHVIREGGIAEAVRPARVLWPLLPQALREIRERKWLARARLHAADGQDEASWAIHEQISLRP